MFHKTIPIVQKASIGTICTSDHVPISINLALQDRLNTQHQWKLNESLLTYEDSRIAIEKELPVEFYFSTNCTPDLTPYTIWEAYIRGILMKKEAEKKKQREAAAQEILRQN